MPIKNKIKAYDCKQKSKDSLRQYIGNFLNFNFTKIYYAHATSLEKLIMIHFINT